MSTTTTSAPGVGASVTEVVAWLAGTDPSTCDRDGLQELVGGVQRCRAWLDAYDTRIARAADHLAATGRSPAGATVLTGRGKRSQRDANRAAGRAKVLDRLSGVEEALDKGDVSGEHVDAIADATAGLDEATKARFDEHEDSLLVKASSMSPEVFGRECRRLAGQLAGDGGANRHQRNRENRKVRRHVDPLSGMCKTTIELDAETDAALWKAIDAAVAAARQDADNAQFTFDHLQVDTIVALITGARAVDRRVPEVTVLIDLDTLINGVHQDSTCETSDGQPLPVEAIRRIACEADIVPVVLGGRGEVLDVGRGSRLATRAQRTALRAMYSTCAYPGCERPFHACQVHHTDPWVNHGDSNLDRLVPICTAHHHLVHDQGWTITVATDRTVTVTRPDGTIEFTGNTTDTARRRPGTTTSGSEASTAA